MTESSKLHKPNSYNKSHLKEKDAIPSYQDISSRFRTEIDTNVHIDEKPR